MILVVEMWLVGLHTCVSWRSPGRLTCTVHKPAMKSWKILRDCRLNGDGVHHAMLGTARLHNLNLAG